MKELWIVGGGGRGDGGKGVVVMIGASVELWVGEECWASRSCHTFDSESGEVIR